MLIDSYLNQITNKIETDLHLIDDPSFDLGLMGIACYYYHLGNYFRSDDFKRRGREILMKGISELNNFGGKGNLIGDTESISAKFAYVGRSLLYVSKNFDKKIEVISLLGDLDGLIDDLQTPHFESHNLDLFSGLLSSGYYYLSRIKNSNAPSEIKRRLGEIVMAIEKFSFTSDDNCIYWKSPRHGDQIYLGLSHGSAMILNFLADSYIISSFRPIVEVMIERAINGIKNCELNLATGKFPNFYVKGKQPSNESTQLSMCYGDLGIISSILKCGVNLKNSSYVRYASNILTSTSKRRFDHRYTYDSSILYGTSGVMCLYKNIQQLGIKIDISLIKYWFDQSLQVLDNQYSNAGRYSMLKPSSVDHDLKLHNSFLWGAAGVGCALMQYAKNENILNELLLTA